MATDPVSAGMTAVTGLAGMEAQGKAAREASRQGAAQRDLIKRQVDFFDRYMKAVEEAKSSGAFDPERQIAGIEADSARYEARDAGGAAAAAARAGFSPQDSPVARSLDRVKLNYREVMDRMRLMVRRQSVMDELGARQGAPAGALNPGIQAAGQNQQNALAGAQGPGGWLQTLMPFLNKKSAPSTTPITGTGTGVLGSGSYMNYQPGASPSPSSGTSLGTGSFWDFMPSTKKKKYELPGWGTT